jgi:hypothetical protein
MINRVGEIFAVLWIVFVGVTYFIPTLVGPVPTSIFTAGYGIFLLIILGRGLLRISQQRNTQNNKSNK